MPAAPSWRRPGSSCRGGSDGAGPPRSRSGRGAPPRHAGDPIAPPRSGGAKAPASGPRRARRARRPRAARGRRRGERQGAYRGRHARRRTGPRRRVSRPPSTERRSARHARTTHAPGSPLRRVRTPTPGAGILPLRPSSVAVMLRASKPEERSVDPRVPTSSPVDHPRSGPEPAGTTHSRVHLVKHGSRPGRFTTERRRRSRADALRRSSRLPVRRCPA
jgi:hypothetical protein